MANPYLNLYRNNPTAGGTDGTALSTGDMTSPLTFILDASISESASDTLAIRCESGFQTCSDTLITDANDTSNHWTYSLDGTNWADSIVITDTIVATNFLFFVNATSSSSENPVNDTSTKIAVTTLIAAV